MPDLWPSSARSDDEPFPFPQPRFPNALKERSRALARRTYTDGVGGSPGTLGAAAAHPYGDLYFEGRPNSGFNPGWIDRSNATSDDAQLTLVGNPMNRRLIRQHEQLTGQAWPVDPKTGRKYDVAHIKALADGGTNTVDNIRPMHPADHRAEHMENGDFSRWSRRQAIARTFGGKVVRGLGPLSALLGLASGQLRTDTWNNTMSDLLGIPSQEDLGWQYGDPQRTLSRKPPPEIL